MQTRIAEPGASHGNDDEKRDRRTSSHPTRETAEAATENGHDSAHYRDPEPGVVLGGATGVAFCPIWTIFPTEGTPSLSTTKSM